MSNLYITVKQAKELYEKQHIAVECNGDNNSFKLVYEDNQIGDDENKYDNG